MNRRRVVTRKEKRGKDFMAVVNERKCMEEGGVQAWEDDNGRAEWRKTSRRRHPVGHARCHLKSFARKTVIENKKRGGTGSITV